MLKFAINATSFIWYTEGTVYTKLGMVPAVRGKYEVVLQQNKVPPRPIHSNLLCCPGKENKMFSMIAVFFFSTWNSRGLALFVHKISLLKQNTMKKKMRLLRLLAKRHRGSFPGVPNPMLYCFKVKPYFPLLSDLWRPLPHKHVSLLQTILIP